MLDTTVRLPLSFVENETKVELWQSMCSFQPLNLCTAVCHSLFLDCQSPKVRIFQIHIGALRTSLTLYYPFINAYVSVP